ncbi:hypothetical protein [Demequina sp. NBRC 110054]|uniref:hypothetical protein n=1 Tax=Demequina sp. NBRC 110054 TaxID=1570343 RepID=UPI0009FF7ADB|nr:hypothetical protein [Demequina sp. NBRC 110054]
MTNHPARDDEFDSALKGLDPEGADMAVLSEAFDALRRTYVSEPDAVHTAAFAGRLAAAVAVAPLGGDPVGVHPRRRVRLQRRAAAAIAVAAAVALSFGGVAAANEAAPGDALYGLDRALERLGINAGGAEERLLEVRALVADDQIAEALDLSVEAVEEMDDLDQEQADELAGLLSAAESVMSDSSETSAERRAQVSAMLTFMAETDLTGREFGRAVSERARGIVSDDDAEAAEDPSTTDESTTGSATTDDAPGNSGDAPGQTKDSGDAATAKDKGASADDAVDEEEADGDEATSSDESAESGSGNGNGNGNANAGGASESHSNAGGNSDTAKQSQSKAGGKAADSDDGDAEEPETD